MSVDFGSLADQGAELEAIGAIDSLHIGALVGRFVPNLVLLRIFCDAGAGRAIVHQKACPNWCCSWASSPGFGAQPFIESVAPKVRDARKLVAVLALFGPQDVPACCGARASLFSRSLSPAAT